MRNLAREVCVFCERHHLPLQVLIEIALAEYLVSHGDEELPVPCEKIELRFCSACGAETMHCISDEDAVCLAH